MPTSRRTLLTAAVAAAAVAAEPAIGRSSWQLSRSAAAQDTAPYFVEGDPGCGRVSLIFNVGSGFEPATGVFDTLNAYGVPVTFFVMGWLADQNPWLVQQMAVYGPVGSHGYNPPELPTRSDDDVANDVQASTTALTNALGYPPAPYFTCYAGSSDDRVRWIIANNGYTPIGWNVRSDDWDPNATANSVYANVMDNVYDGAIVELHMDSTTSTWTTATALPWIIGDLQGRGYQLVSVPQMMGSC